MDKIFFDSWDSILRTLIISVLAYTALIAMLRMVGNRPLTQLNAFDFIVNVALGSTLATVLLNKDVALADGVLTFLILIILQMIIRYLNKRSEKFSKLVKTKPQLLFYQGEYLEDALDKNSISREEILQIVRSEGVGDLDKIGAIVLETNGRFSVIQQLKEDDRSVLKKIKN